MANRNNPRGPHNPGQGRGSFGRTGGGGGGFGGGPIGPVRGVNVAAGPNKMEDDDHGNGSGLTHMGQVMAQRMMTAQIISGAPTYDLPLKERTDDDKKFTGRCRLFVANLPPNVTDSSLKNLFEQYGEVAEVFIGKGNTFAFIKMDTRKHAEEARDALDNKNYEGRTLRVRLAAHAAAIRVKNLSPLVTNELLEYAFSFFGDVERAIVITDDRGRSVCEGIVEFARKNSAQICLKRCQQECFLLTANPAPVIVEPFETKDEEDGFSEKHLNRSGPDYRMERELGPRFAEPGTFEYDFGCRFKELYEIEREKRARLEQEVVDARNQLMNTMEFQRMEYQTKILKEKLREMEERSAIFNSARTENLELEKRREEERQQHEAMLRQREEEILRRSQISDYAGLRRQENDLRMQASALQDMLDRQEATLGQLSTTEHGMFGGGGGPRHGPGGFAGPHDMMEGPPVGYPPFAVDDPYFGMGTNGSMDMGRGGGYPPPPSQGLPPPQVAPFQRGGGGGPRGNLGQNQRPAPYGNKRGKKF